MCSYSLLSSRGRKTSGYDASQVGNIHKIKLAVQFCIPNGKRGISIRQNIRVHSKLYSLSSKPIKPSSLDMLYLKYVNR